MPGPRTPLACAAVVLVLTAAAAGAASDWQGLLQVRPVRPKQTERVPLKGYEWDVVSTQYFRLYAMPGVHPEHVRQVAERVDNIWRFLKGRAGVECESRILVFLPADRSSYNALVKPFASRRRSAQYPDAQDYLNKSAVAIDTHNYVDRLASIMHQAAHLFRHTREDQSHQDTGPWRWWAGEFMARYFSMGLERTYAVLRPRQELYAMWFRDRMLPPWRGLEQMKARSIRPRSRHFNLLVVESILHFLEQTYGQEQMTKLWRTCLDARREQYPDTGAIFQAVFGKSVDALEREWYAYYDVGLPAWYLSQAQQAYGKSDYAQCLAQATAVLDTVPPNAMRYVKWKYAWGLAGACFREAGLVGEAESHFEAAAMVPHRGSLGPDLDPFSAHRRRAQPKAPKGEELALPDDEPSLSQLAHYLYRRNDFTRAGRAYDKLVTQFPNSPAAASYHFTYGQLLKRQGHLEQARRVWEAAARYPNSYHALRAQIYLAQHVAGLHTPKAKADAQRRLQRVLDTPVLGDGARYSASLRRWAQRELAKLSSGKGATVRPVASPSDEPSVRLVTRYRAPASMATRISTAVAASPCAAAQIDAVIEKYQALQMATWADLADAGATRLPWLTVQARLLLTRRREVEDQLDKGQNADLAAWFVARLQGPIHPEPLPQEGDRYKAACADLHRWVRQWKQAQLLQLRTTANLDAETEAKIVALVEHHRADTRALWEARAQEGASKDVAKRHAALEREFRAQVSKAVGPPRAQAVWRWWEEQRGQLVQFNGVVRHRPPPTHDDL